MNSEEKNRTWKWSRLPLGAAVVAFILMLHAATVETPTVDEFAHVPAGAAYWAYGNYELYFKNPPLMKELMAFPIWASGATIPNPTAIPASGWQPWIYGTAFQQVNQDRYFEWFLYARLVVILVFLFSGYLLWRWSKKLFQEPAAALCTSLYLLSPTLLAHGHLGTIDVGCMATIFCAAFTFRWAYRQPSLGRMAIVGGVWGIALLTKFTAVLLLPAFLGMTVYLNFKSKPSEEGRSVWKNCVQDFALQLGVAVLVINLGMGFQGTFKSLGGYSLTSSFGQTVQSVLPGVLPVPLPEAYVAGFDAQKRDTELGEFGSYLFGEWSDKGWWYYNFVALLVKVPLPVLGLMFAGLFGLKQFSSQNKTEHERAATELLYWLVPPLVIGFFLIVFNRLNIGIRYLLPLFPFLFLLIGAAGDLLFKKLGSRRGSLLVGAVLVMQLVSVLGSHPNYLTYFNATTVLAGGGEEVLLDSNLDWGQDLYRLPALLDELEHEEPVQLLYFGHVDPRMYGVEFEVCPSKPVQGIVVVSANYVKGASYVTPAPQEIFQQIAAGHASWLAELEPVRKLGTLWVYDTRAMAP